MKIKTYGVPDLTEWHGKVKAGSLEVSVSFRGGTASPSGAQPAYYVTRDPIVQFVIENSREFKNGFIILVMSQEIAGEHPRMAVPKPKPTVKTDASKKAKELSAGVEPVVPSGEEPVVPSGGESSGDGLVKLHAGDKSEAIEYLKEHYPERNYTATSLRTKAAFDAACADCGVEFVFTS